VQSLKAFESEMGQENSDYESRKKSNGSDNKLRAFYAVSYVLSSDPVRLLRIFAVIVIVSQLLRFFSQLSLGVEPLARLAWYHGFNTVVAVVVLALSASPKFRRWWPVTMFIACCLVVVNATAKNVVGGNLTEALFVSLLLMVFGTALLVPWGFRWQAALNIVVIADMALNDVLVPPGSDVMALHWFGLVFAAALAQSASWLAEYSREQDRHVKQLTESGERLRMEIARRVEAEQKLRENLTELKRIQEELVRAREDALAASKAKSEFLSSMSHEIRTPVNVILGMAELLSETALTGEQRRFLEVMRSNISALLALISDVLDLARIESGRIELESANFELDRLVEQLVSDTAILAHEKGLELIARIEPQVPTALIGDPLRLTQILTNLLSNAIKFTSAGQVLLSVAVAQPSTEEGVSGVSTTDSADANRSWLHFTVSDTGIGIPQTRLQTIFDSFAQADSSTTRRFGGAGLGLAIVKRLVELQGGSIWVESEVGKGSTFHVILPFRVQTDALRADKPKGEWDEALRLEGLRVLVVDDSELNQEVVKEILSESGAEIEGASSSEQALAKLERAIEIGAPYGLLIIDSTISDPDGFQLVENVKNRALAGDGIGALPIIMMLTTAHLNEQVKRAEALGVDYYIVKPVRRADLLSVVGKVLGGKREFAQASLQTQAGDAVAEAFDAPLSILLAEDSEDNKFVISAYLKNTPHKLDFAENGEKAVERFIAARKAATGYDVVLMDIQMPVMDGYTAVRLIRQWEQQNGESRAFIVALTASALSEDISKCFEAGCDSYIAKPVRKRTLLEVLEQARNAGRSMSLSLPLSADNRSGNQSQVAEVVPPDLGSLMPQFITRKRQDLAQLLDASKHRDYATIRALGHRIKGDGQMMGFEVMSKVGQALEIAAEGENLEEIRRLIQTLSNYLSSIRIDPR